MDENELMKLDESSIDNLYENADEDGLKSIRDIMLVAKLICQGNTKPSKLLEALESKGMNWSWNKIKRYMSDAYTLLNTEKGIKSMMDQRHVLISGVEEVVSSAWEEIEEKKRKRGQAYALVQNGTPVESLPSDLKDVYSLSEDRFSAMIDKKKEIILKAIKEQSDLYGYSQDKRVLIQHEKSDKVKYLDDINRGAISEYRGHHPKDVTIIELAGILKDKALAEDEYSTEVGTLEDLDNDD